MEFFKSWQLKRQSRKPLKCPRTPSSLNCETAVACRFRSRGIHAWLKRRPANDGIGRLIGSGIGVHWPDIDEDISVEALLAGFASNESATSLRRWRASRQHPASKRLKPAARGVAKRRG